MGEASERTSDDEHELVSPSPAQWRQFERHVAALQRDASPDARVEHDARLPGRFSGAMRQIDVLVSTEVRVVGGGEPLQLRVVVECKRYAQPLGIGAVEEFIGKLLDVGAACGVLCCVTRFTGPAVARAGNASQPQLRLVVLTDGDDDQVEPDYSEWLDFDCPTDHCYGHVRWQPAVAADGATIAVGYCTSCGVFAVRCAECGFIVEPLESEICGCDATYTASLTYESKGTEYGPVTRTEGGCESEFVW